MNAIFEIWSEIMPERAMACSFNLEYLLVGGRDGAHATSSRSSCGTTGWSAAGAAATARTAPTAPRRCSASGWPCSRSRARSASRRSSPRGHADRHRLRRPRHVTAAAAGSRRAARSREAERTVMSYCCDRARSITWGIEGGLPSLPHGVWLNQGSDGRALPRRGLLERPGRRGRHVHAPVGGRRRVRRPAGARPRRRLRGRRRRLRLGRARAQGLRRRRARARRRPRGVRGRRRGHRARARAHRAPSARAGSRRTPRRRRAATATASSTCSTSSATTA